MMVPIPQACRTDYTGAEIVCAEKGRKMVFLNPKHRRVARIEIDGCDVLRRSLKDKTCKLCDFAVIDWRPEVHFIELKGANVERALQQIESTIVQLRGTPTECWIITTESPRTQSKFQVLKEKFQRRHNTRLTIRTNQHSHPLE